MLPSAQTLDRAFPGHGRAVRALLDGTRDPFSYPAVEAWRRQCYNDPNPRRCDTIMQAVNVEVAGYGDEAIRGRYVDRYYQDIQACYINLGDAYTLTLLHDHETDRYIVTSWGDWVERNGRKREIE